MADTLARLRTALADRYAVEHEAGQGGMATVYAAHDRRHDRRVAIKVLSPEIASALGTERFLQEIRLTARLTHPHILPLYDSGESGGFVFYVMPFIAGESLRARLQREGRLPLDEALRIGREVASALEYAHRQEIVHRDIKPENILLQEGYALVADFGIARAVTAAGGSHLTQTGFVIGSPAYMSPEQALGDQVGPPSDLFSLGIALYEVLAGAHPFGQGDRVSTVASSLLGSAMPPSATNPEVPPSLDALILELLDPDPAHRPSAGELAARLTAPVERSATQVPRPAIPERHTVGREPELAALHAALNAVVAGPGMVVCVTGEPGGGKTTVVEEFLAEVTAGSGAPRVGRGRCSERLAGTGAYLPVLEVLDNLLATDPSGTTARLFRLSSPTWYAEVAPAPAGGSPSGPKALEAASQERMKRELSAFLQDLSHRGPVVLFLEDIHWADPSTVDLIAYLGDRFDALRALVVVTFRPADLLLAKHPFHDVKLELQARGRCRELALDFLAPPDVERYLALEFGSHAFPPDFGRMIHARTEGSPLFMVDLLRYLRDHGVIVQAERRWSLAGSVQDALRELPASVRGMIERKIERVSDRDRRVLLAASVQGVEFDSTVVARALSLEPADVEEQLQELERAHALIRLVGEKELPDRTPSLRYRFVHVLYQNALYKSLGPSRRVALSAAVAQGLERGYGAKRGEVAAELALLHEAARDFERAADHFLLAAQNAARVAAYREALLLARHGLEALSAVPEGEDRARRELALQVALGGLLIVTEGSGAPDVEPAYRRAWQVGQHLAETPELFTALRGLSEFYHTSGQLETGLEWAERALAVAERLDDPALVVDAHHAVAMPLLYLARLEQARQHLEQGIARYDPEQRRRYGALYHAIDPGVGCRFQAGRVLWLLGYPDRALAHAEEGIALARRIGHRYSLANICVSASLVHQCRGEPDRARHRAEEAMALAGELELLDFFAWASIWRGWAIAAEGRLDEGIAEMRQGIAGHGTNRAVHPHRLALLAEMLGRRGDVNEALELVAEGLGESERGAGGRYYRAELFRLKGELLWQGGSSRVGEEAEAEQCLRTAVAVAHEQGARSLELRALVSLGRLLQPRGRGNEVRGALEELCAWFTEGEDTMDLVEARGLLQALAFP